MIPGLVLSIAVTGALLGAIVVAAGLSSGPPLRSSGPAPPAAAVVTGSAPMWVCVTPGGYCLSPPRRSDEPCSCLEPWQGWQHGRVHAGPAPPRGVGQRWPARPPAAAGDDPEESWMVAP